VSLYGFALITTGTSLVALARQVKHSVGIFEPFPQLSDSLLGWQKQQLDFAALRLVFEFLHHWKPAVRAGSNHKPSASPGDRFFDRQWRMAELLMELLGRFLVSFANQTAIDDDVVFVSPAINLDGAKGEFLETHNVPLQQSPSNAPS
jgi:hypothetical protein